MEKQFRDSNLPKTKIISSTKNKKYFILGRCHSLTMWQGRDGMTEMGGRLGKNFVTHTHRYAMKEIDAES